MTTLNYSIFGFDANEMENINLKNNQLQEVIYEFGQVMYKLGRMETDEKQSTKEYNQYCKKREELTKKIDEFFKNS
jgi:hypothetical protein